MNLQEPSYFPEREGAEQPDPLLQELEDSMPQGVPNSTRPANDDPDDDFAALDQLLSESTTAAEAEAQYKKDRESLRRGYAGLSREEVAFCNSRMHAFEMAREWDVEAAYAVFVQHTCMKCGTARTVFSRLIEKHQHRRVATTKRWLVVSETKLPLQVAVEERELAMCLDCMGDYGLALTEDTPWLEDLINGS